MDLIPYATQSIDDADLAAVREVLSSGWLTQGPAVPRFEAAFAERHQVSQAVAVSNATAGLHIACLAMGAGPGKIVWTSPNSFLASANCALYCGARVDFVDIDPATRNMSVAALSEKLERSEREHSLPHIVIPVHFAGLSCDLTAMRALADRYGFKLLADASHATGGSYAGRPIGSTAAHASVFSFHPVKIITTGEGGMVVTEDEGLARQLRLLRSHGMVRDAASMLFPDANSGAWYYEQQQLGFNYRMTDIQAALGASQLTRLDAFHAARVALAQRYDSLLKGLPLRLPVQPADCISAWHLYVVEVISGVGVAPRALVFQRLRDAGIGVNVHYFPIHLQPYYRKLNFGPGQFPHAEAYYAGAISIPLYPALTFQQQDRVKAELVRALRT